MWKLHYPFGRNQRKTKETLDESGKGEWKSWLKIQHSKNEDYGIWSYQFMANRRRNNENVEWFYFLRIPNHWRWWRQPQNSKMLAPWKKSYDNPREHIKYQRHYFAHKGPSSQSYGFSSSHVRMWELDHKESRRAENECFWTVVLEKTLESPLNCQEIQPVNPKGNESWTFIGRTEAAAEAPILWPPDANNWLIRKDPDAGKDWSQEEKGMMEDEMAWWHHWLDKHEFEQALGVGDG